MSTSRQKPRYIYVRTEHAGLPLSECIAHYLPQSSLEEIRSFIRDGRVYVNKKRILSPEKKPNHGDLITVYPAIGQAVPLNVNLTLLHKEPGFVAVDKPSGVPSDATREGRRGTVTDLLKRQLPKSRYLEPVHRLDKGTSGIILISLKPSFTKMLMKQFRERTIQKTYMAVVNGSPHPASGRLEQLLVKHASDPRKMRVVKADGKRAVTDYRVIKVNNTHGFALVEITIHTGRRHQIRVQFAQMGFPVAGDWLYGRKSNAPRLMLHACRLQFRHPVTGDPMVIESPLPDEFQELLTKK